MAITITTKLMEENIEKFFNKKVWYIGKTMDNHGKIISPTQHAFLRMDDSGGDFLLTFNEDLIIEILKK
jgi:hypothetical protein